ncbi:MAG: RNA polymerase sigma factor [Verrucomicrobiaceae bacterium]
MPDLAPLLKRIGEKDSIALRELHQAVSGAVLGVIVSILKDRHDSEDVLQEVFLRIWKRANRYSSDRGSPMSWIITIARNAAFDRYRKRNRQAAAREEATPDLKEALVSSPAIASHELLRAELCDEVKKALTSLSEDQREAIELAFFSGHTQTEVAARLAVPLGTVKARIRRGMQSLKPLLIQRA